jgi:glycosyltransferase involved in cell wall biosynthesis
MLPGNRTQNALCPATGANRHTTKTILIDDHTWQYYRERELPVRILMIAPQPFMEERGAPFAIYYHIKALLAMGFTVDLVTYHIGQPVNLPGLTIYRTPAMPFLKQIKVGPSLAKIPLGFLVFCVALWRMCTTRYYYLHTHEEAGLIGIILGKLFGVKHLYYMHSDLSQQIVSSEFIEQPFLIRMVKAVQTFLVRHSDSVIAVCPDIETSALTMSNSTPIFMVENCAVDEGLPEPHPAEIARLRASLQLGDGPVLLYTGTLESYQGLDLLLESMPQIQSSRPDVRYLIVGGKPEQVERLQAQATRLGVAEAVRFTGLRPLTEMPAYMAIADILVSPRSKGTNTPLKLYTYLRSGKPILATDIHSQTQVLTSEFAALVPPTPEGITQGAFKLLNDPSHARSMGERGQRFAEEHYTWQAFLQKAIAVQREFAAEHVTAPLDTSKQELTFV